MNGHALEVLELGAALRLIARRATSDAGRRAVLALLPSHDLDEVRFELERVGAMMDLLQETPTWSPPPVPEVREILVRLRIEGSVLEASELHRVGVLLASSRRLADDLDGRPSRPPLAPLRQLLLRAEDLEGDLHRSVDHEGAVLDTASKELRRVRSALQSAHTRIVRRLEAFVRTLPNRIVVADASVTVREGRYVVPVRREGRGEVGGIVHDESGTGATIFVEPPVAVELMNELRDLERDEAIEVRRVLRELCERIRPLAQAAIGASDALVDLDTLYARARAALEWEATPPEVHPAGGGALCVKQGRHPLLLASEEAVVPYDLELSDDERTVVVSGPNTGGKSVFLKFMGLMAALTQSGVVPPVGKGTSLPLFGDVFADIGDEQSIAQSLSTFSAHMANLREIVAAADANSLVLMDEMGTGTDPTEGAALARAILEELTARGARSIVTSHLGALKTLDAPGSGVVNASLQFDADRMEPTYHFVKGRPGRSYGLAIARKLGFPVELLDRSQELVDEGSASLEDLLERLEARERSVEALQKRLEVATDEAEGLSRELAERERRLHVSERDLERKAREDARKLLMEARGEVEEAIREVQAAGGADSDEVARSARRRVEEAAHEQASHKPTPRRSGAAVAGLEVGARVRLPGAGRRGTVLELREGRASVDVGGLRMELPADELERVEDGGDEPARTASSTGRWQAVLPAGGPEVDLRGLRVDEVELQLGRALDAALLSDLNEVRIIHGMGTGAVRARVQELLTADPRIREHRLGVHGEGGAGVTLAWFR